MNLELTWAGLLQVCSYRPRVGGSCPPLDLPCSLHGHSLSSIIRKCICVAILAIVALLAGCAIALETHLPDGKMGYAIDCSGHANSISFCFAKAGDLCGARGYKVYEQANLNLSFGAHQPKGLLIGCNE